MEDCCSALAFPIAPTGEVGEEPLQCLVDIGKFNGEERRTNGLPHERHHTPGLIDGSLVQTMALF